MFNTPILDITIGLVFIFLLYSLLATSINELIATSLALRARMLRKGIVESMLSDTPNYTRWQSIAIGVWQYICEFVWIFIGRPKTKEKKLGDYFYDHPLIKNYGENRVFPNPSYLKTGNFSTVMLDVLKKDFDAKLDDISQFYFSRQSNTQSLPDVKSELLHGNDIVKIKALLEYYANCYATRALPANNLIDKDTLDILQLHLKNSIYNIEAFIKKLEGWFDDTMNRVSGWYKRQAQAILFLIGLALAITFNVDVISITKKLSKDDTLREQVVQTAIAYSNQRPQQKKDSNASVTTPADSSDSVYRKNVEEKFSKVDTMLNTDIKDMTLLMALGWSDYGRAADSAVVIKKYQSEFDSMLAKLQADTSAKKCSNPDKCKSIALKNLYDNHWIVLKVGYVLSSSFHAVKFLGFLLLAFAVCLGAPFWFDSLNKIINLRAAGKQESTAPTTGQTQTQQPALQPVTINVNTNNQPGQEAVG